MKLLNDAVEYEDYKYVLQDVGSIYLGARYTYEDLLAGEMVPFKLKAILNHYVLKESAPDTSLESQFYYLEPESFLYEIFNQLKVKVRVQVREEKKGFLGKSRFVYEEKVLPLKELVETTPAQKKARGMIIREVIISKLGLMTFSV